MAGIPRQKKFEQMQKKNRHIFRVRFRLDRLLMKKPFRGSFG
jgi:hypothetical protein